MALTLLNKIKFYLFTYDWEVIELQGAIFKIAWGLWLVMPFQSYRAAGGITASRYENYWAIALLVLGVLHFWSIKSGHLKWRRRFTFIAFAFWLFTILVVGQSSWSSPLIPFFVIIAFFMALNNIRLGMPPKIEIKT